MSSTATTTEEARAELEAPQAILRRSGFAAAAPLFSADLATAGDLAGANRIVTSHGRRLWAEAVRQNGVVSDDRALYWARLTLTARLRSWRPGFPLTEEERSGLLTRIEHASRGHDDLVFPPGERLLRVIVTGFDPYRLDEDVRGSNPSGVAALALHGATFDIGEHTAVLRTALFPVRWRDLTAGMVEHTLAPHYAADDGPGAAAVITVSQGREGRFDLEAYNGAWRGDGADNEGVSAPQQIPPRPDSPAVDPRPQWCASTLPRQAITERATGRFPVYDHTEVTEIPTGETEPVTRPDGPTPDSTARRGGGGDYVSNEIAYRVTLLRDATGHAIPAGHVHTPVLRPDTGGSDSLSDADFERDRTDIVAQVRAIIVAAIGG